MTDCMRIAAGATVSVLALLLTACAASAGVAVVSESPTVVLSKSDETIVADVVGDGAVDYEGIQAEWTRAVAAWPLPVPSARPFPQQYPIKDLNEWDYYESGSALKKASFWWECADNEAIEQAHADEEADDADYWVEAFETWKSSSAGAFAIDNITAVRLGTSCAGFPGFDPSVAIVSP
ncbi:hypothetical protein [uncultured Microbacterium sp.]|nr:hypothetical protein [uncultured Microbacterium sp.]